MRGVQDNQDRLRLNRAQWLKRRRQWEKFAAWEGTARPDQGDTGTRLRRVGEMMDMWLSCQDRNKSNKGSGVAGIRMMREKLARVRIFRDRV